MRKQSRGAAPEFLASKWEEWGLAWEENLTKDKRSAWNWRQLDNEKVNLKLLPPLKLQAGNHCSFCDACPVSPPSNETIEHFRPKSKFPRLAWQWENLYFCCDFCQGRKSEKWEPELLAPDQLGYAFADYFYPDYTTGKIEVRPDISTEMQKSAECTLLLYGLNHPRHLPCRLDAQERRSALQEWDINRFPYRDFLEAGEKGSAI